MIATEDQCPNCIQGKHELMDLRIERVQRKSFSEMRGYPAHTIFFFRCVQHNSFSLFLDMRFPKGGILYRRNSLTCRIGSQQISNSDAGIPALYVFAHQCRPAAPVRAGNQHSGNLLSLCSHPKTQKLHVQAGCLRRSRKLGP